MLYMSIGKVLGLKIVVSRLSVDIQKFFIQGNKIVDCIIEVAFPQIPQIHSVAYVVRLRGYEKCLIFLRV